MKCEREFSRISSLKNHVSFFHPDTNENSGNSEEFSDNSEEDSNRSEEDSDRSEEDSDNSGKLSDKSGKESAKLTRKIKKDVENSIKNECYETIKSLQKQIISDSEDENTKKMNNRKPRKPKSSRENDNPYKKVYKSSHRKPIQRNTEDIDFMNIKNNISVSQIEEINTDDMC